MTTSPQSGLTEMLTLLFDQDTSRYFRTDKAGRTFIRQRSLGVLDDGQLNDWNGGRGVYFKDPNGHVLELMTVPQ